MRGTERRNLVSAIVAPLKTWLQPFYTERRDQEAVDEQICWTRVEADFCNQILVGKLLMRSAQYRPKPLTGRRNQAAVDEIEDAIASLDVPAQAIWFLAKFRNDSWGGSSQGGE